MTVEIHLNNGKVIKAQIEDYQAATLAQSLNDNRILFITIGNIILNRNIIQMVLPANEPTT